MSFKVAYLLVLAGLLTSRIASAIYDPTWERPIFKGTLTETDSSGHEVNSSSQSELSINRRDGEQKYSSFTFIETIGTSQGTDTQFDIRSINSDECGSTRYVAIERRVKKRGYRRFRPRILSVLDHSTRQCDDFKEYQWEIELRGRRGHTRYFFGNPEEVISIMLGP